MFTKMQREALREFLLHYKAHFDFAWSQRAAMDPPQRLAHEVEFLPAALSLQEKPVHPAPRVAMQLIIGFAALALIWSIIGKVDIVATASGKIIPNDRIKVIQPLETALVKAIHVRDGQAVKAGDILIELDATMAQADTDRTRVDWQQAQLDAARAKAMLAALDHNSATAIMTDPLDGSVPERFTAAQRFLVGQYSEYRSKYQQLNAEFAQHEAERNATLEQKNKLEQTLPIVAQRASDLKDLLDKNYVGRHEYLEKEQLRIEMERDLAVSSAKLAELDAVMLTTKRQKEALTAETQRTQLDQLHEAEQKMSEYQQDFIKASGRRESMTLAASVDGTVQQLAIHTIGGVVTPAQQLMVIVPKENTLEVEAFVQNKDIGFVNAGQEAQIKIETFPFTKYGTIRGTVLHVSNDAIQQESKQQNSQQQSNSMFASDENEKTGGLVYSARVKLEKSTIQVEGKAINLTPGMAVTVEIKTGKRRLIEYFLSPLIQYKDESLRER
jgi:hemolysin D